MKPEPNKSAITPAPLDAPDLAEIIRRNTHVLTELLDFIAWMIGPDGPFAVVYASPPKSDIELLKKALYHLTAIPSSSDSQAIMILLTQWRDGQDVVWRLRKQLTTSSWLRRVSTRLGLTPRLSFTAKSELVRELDGFIREFDQKYNELASAAGIEAPIHAGRSFGAVGKPIAASSPADSVA